MAQFKKDYTYVTDKDENQVCVAVVGGKYDGVIYKYGKVSVPNENNLNPDGSLPFQFVLSHKLYASGPCENQRKSRWPG